MAKWLDKYEQGGLVLKKKTKDNYGKKPNPNNVEASVGPDFVGQGYTAYNWKSPAWGGQFQHGGFLQPTSSKLPEGYVIPYNTPSTELAMSIGGEKGEPAYLIPSFKGGKKLKDPIAEFKKTGEHLGGPFKTWQEAEKFGEMRHQYVEKGQDIPTPLKTWGDMAMGGNIPGSVGFTYARTQDPAPSNGPYAKKTLASAQDGIDLQKAWLTSYLQSPKYKERLGKEFAGQSDEFIQQENDARLNNLLNAKTKYVKSIGNSPGWISGMMVPKENKGEIYDNASKKFIKNKWSPGARGYDKKGTVYLENEYRPDHWNPSEGFETTPLHELGHAVDDAGYRIPASTEKKIHNYTDWQSISKSLNLPNYKNNGLTFDYYNTPSEFINRIQPIRYLLNKEGLYDARTSDFTEKDYDNMLKNKNLNNNQHYKDVMNSLKGDKKQKKKAFVDLMNTVAKVDDNENVDAAQDGKEIMKGKEFVEQWMNSPKYNEMLSASAQGPELERISKGRIESFNVPTLVHKLEELRGTDTMGNQKLRVKNMFNATPSELEDMTKVLQYSINNPKDKEAKRKAKKVTDSEITGWEIGLNPVLEPGTADYEAVLAHEFGHNTGRPFMSKLPYEMSTKELMGQDRKPFIPVSDIEKMKKYSEGKINDNLTKYVSDPEETRQYINELRYLGKTQGVYDPFKEKITPEQYKKIRALKDTDPAETLRKVYTDDQIIDMLNSVSKNDYKTVTPQAQNGKEMSFYQEGLDFTPKTISKNGSVIKDDMGQWAHPGEITEINSNDITMEGVDYPVLGVSDTEDTKLMQPGENYKFKGKKVTEYPMMKKGGWLNKYK